MVLNHLEIVRQGSDAYASSTTTDSSSTPRLKKSASKTPEDCSSRSTNDAEIRRNSLNNGELLNGEGGLTVIRDVPNSEFPYSEGENYDHSNQGEDPDLTSSSAKAFPQNVVQRLNNIENAGKKKMELFYLSKLL